MPACARGRRGSRHGSLDRRLVRVYLSPHHQQREAVMNRSVAVCAAVLTISLGFDAASGALAQPPAAPADLRPAKNPLEGNAQAISNGAAMFRNRCAGCHGPDAHGYLGPDLTNFWANGGSDEKMLGIVRRGVPGTEMIGADPQRVLDKDIWQTIAYLRTLGTV